MTALLSRLPVKAGGYAAIVVGIIFLALLVSAGLRSAPRVTMLPLDQHFGWDCATISAAAAIGVFLYGLIGPLAAALMLTIGIKRTMLGGLALMGLFDLIGTTASC